MTNQINIDTETGKWLLTPVLQHGKHTLCCIRPMYQGGTMGSVFRFSAGEAKQLQTYQTSKLESC